MLKLWQNKNGQTFVEMLVFACLFCSRQVMQIQKKHAKTEHQNKRLTFLVLMGLYHLSLSREILLSLWIEYMPGNLTTPCCYLAVAIFTSISWESYIQNLNRKKGVWGTNLLSKEPWKKDCCLVSVEDFFLCILIYITRYKISFDRYLTTLEFQI